MKKRILTICLCLCFIFCFAFQFHNKSYADPFTAAQIGAASYAIMNGWGITFNATAATGQGMLSFMSGQVEEYVNQRGGTIADVFVGQMVKDAAGKLVVAYDLYNSIIEFKDYLISKFGLTDNYIDVSAGSIGGVTCVFSNPVGVGFKTEYISYPAAASNPKEYTRDAGSFCWTGKFTVSYNPTRNSIFVNTPLAYRDGQEYNPDAGVSFSVSGNPIENQLQWNGSDYVAPTVLNPNKEWVGDVGGAPDTNLDQLLDGIGQDVADNNLDVEGEVIDVPMPTPTPIPIDPDTPLQDVPWDGLDTNLKDLYDQGLEEIGKIGEAQEAITDAVADQTDVIEGAIADNAGIVSGAIDQAVSDVQTAIGEQTLALDESLSATAEGVEAIAEAIEDEEINWRKFDLRGLFPFCIPFDIYNMLHALDASPVAPHVRLPFVIQSIGFSYTMDLDFSAFDSVAAIMRQMELICYGLALAWATSKVIKW